MATNPQVQRQRQLTSASPTVVIPPFPRIFEGFKRRLPDQRVAIEKAERDLESWREQVQHVINQALLNR